MEYKDYYKSLGVSKTAGAQEIKSAYRKLARQSHPDLHPNDKKAEERFKEINEAYEVLSDPAKRKKYDELGANWEQILRDKEYARQYAPPGSEWAGAETVDLNDFFETFFGGLGGRAGRAGRGRRTQRGEDLLHPVELTLEEAFHGTSRRLQLDVDQPCGRCGGSGMVVETHTKGATRRTAQTTTCPTCGGHGSLKERKNLDVKIPRGVTEASRVRLTGMGGGGAGGGAAGDLYLEIHLRPHRLFHVNDHDLSCELPVRDDEAALGTTVDVPTLEGRVSLTIPPGSQSGSRLRLKGKGLPHLHGSGRGDLYYRLKIVTPAALTDEEKELILQLKQLRERQGDRRDPRRALFS